MDPLSISTAIITCMGATAALANTIQKLHRLRKAPKEIACLEDEIVAVNKHVEHVGDLLRAPSHCRPAIIKDLSLQPAIEAARTKVEQVKSFLENKLLKDNSAELKKSAWLKWQSEFGRLKQDLRDVRIDLGFCINLSSASMVHQNEMQLEKIIVDGKEMHTRHHEALKALQEEIAQQRPALAAELALQLTSFQAALVSSLQGTPQIGRRYSEQSTPLDLDSPPERPNLRGRSWSTGNAALSSDHTIDLSQKVSLFCQKTITFMPGDPFEDKSETPTKQASVALQLSKRQPGRCRAFCGCQCHHATKFKTPSALRMLTGQLLVDYAGTSFTPPCNEHACAQRQKATMRIQYQFPVWSYIQGILTLVSTSNGARGPEKILRLSRLRPGLHEIFIQVQAGDNRRLAQMFSNGEASPFDATDTGWTPLHLALTAGQLHTAKFLKDAGADLNAESLRRETPFDIAWNRIMSGYLDAASELTLREVFNDTYQLDAREFTNLHKIVLGLSGRDLLEELQTSTANIDRRDSTGYTPLAWAAARGDSISVQLLLEYGASATLANNLAQQPIHLAAQTGNVETVRILAQAGADINAAMPETKMTPLHYAAESQDDKDHILGMVDLGACVDGRDYCGWTPLHWACWRGYSDSLTGLLKAWADVRAKTTDGNAAVMLAVTNNSFSCIPTLIEAGANCAVVKPNGWSVLHYAAIGGKPCTLRALAKGDLTGSDMYDLHTADSKQTVSDMLSARLSALETQGDDKLEELHEIQDAWTLIMDKVSPSRVSTRRGSISSIASIDDDCAFVDACSDWSQLEMGSNVVAAAA
ncbi:Ankyrin-3 [Pseudocercospora fuligena]|uniref:Ankyrin-3 n=1 Tax=Pseudocercospora fuligena TaxID=685502 RepID=A0A8H6VPU3_9PEZI|nr:Ankyrin-3 [Pseudocercospora fuligena]